MDPGIIPAPALRYPRSYLAREALSRDAGGEIVAQQLHDHGALEGHVARGDPEASAQWAAAVLTDSALEAFLTLPAPVAYANSSARRARSGRRGREVLMHPAEHLMVPTSAVERVEHPVALVLEDEAS